MRLIATISARARAAGAPLALLVLLALAVVSLGQRYRSRPEAFNSDDLYLVEVCEDLLGRGPELKGLHLPCAPYILPDMLLLLVAVALCKDLLAVFLVYNVLFFGVLLTVLTVLFRQTGLRTREAFLFACSGLVLLIATHLGAPYWQRGLLLFHPGNHAGALLTGLLLTLLVVRNLHRRLPHLAAAAFVVVGGLGLLSDRLLLAQFLVPVVLSVVLLALCGAVSLWKAAETLILAAGAYVLSLAGQQILIQSGWKLLPLNGLIDFEKAEVALTAFTSDVFGYTKKQYVLFGVFLGFVPAAAAVAWRQFGLASGQGLAPLGTGCPRVARDSRTFRPAGQRIACPPEAAAPGRRTAVATAAIASTALLCALCNIAAVVVSGAASRHDADRYLLGAFCVPFLFLGVFLRLLPGRRFQFLARVCPAAIALVASVQMIVSLGFSFPFRELRQSYPETAEALDRLARQGKIHSGITTYWHARRLQYLSKEHVPLKTVWGNGEPWLHGQNPNGWLATDRRSLALPHYDFVLLDEHDGDRPMRREHYLRLFGTPRETIRVEGREIWIYDGLLHGPFCLFLRSTLAARCRVREPFLGPASPAALARPRDNLAAKDLPGNVLLAPGEEVLVTFARPVKGTTLDFGAHFNGHYDVLFYRGATLVGRLYVPRVLCPSVSMPYCRAGNQSRLLSLPRALCEQEWTSARIRAREGPGEFAVSHFLVYERTPAGLKARQARVGGRWRFEAEHQPTEVTAAESITEDPAASGGRARFAPPEFSGPVVYGPYVSLEGGRYRVDFLVKAGPGVGPVAQVDVTSQSGNLVHAQRVLDAADFAGKEGYQKFSLEFETEVELADCEFRVFALGKVPVYADYVELVSER